MKKILLASALVATMGIGAFSVYADSSDTTEFDRDYGHMYNDDINKSQSNREIFTDEERQEWFDGRQAEQLERREERIEAALLDGRITEDEAVEWRAENEENNRFREGNGFNRNSHHHGSMRNDFRQNRTRRCH